MEVQYFHFETIDSTNVYAKNHALQFDPKKITCITADIQTSGRGRFSRKWVSVKGNLFLTLFFCIPSGDPLLPSLAQLCAFSVAKILQDAGIKVEIKWPNDLMVDRKKLSGILVETLVLRENSTGVVVGLGMNVNTPVDADQPTTSLFEVTGEKWNLRMLRDTIISRFQKDLEKGFFRIRGEFEELLAYKGEKIGCQIDNKLIEGTVLGIDPLGCLRLQQENGNILTIFSGEITKMYTQMQGTPMQTHPNSCQ